MSVIVYSVAELSSVASSFYQEFREFIDSYQERQTAKQEALHEHEKRDDLSIRLDNYRWIWERVSIANQAESLQTYSKYGHSESITHNRINVLSNAMPMPKAELYKQLKLIRYNSSTYLAPEIASKLDGYISMIADRLIRENKV